MQPPGRPDGVGVAERQDVGRPVREMDAGAGRRGLHDGLGVVGGRVGQRLVLRRDAERRAVVVRPVVQRGDPAGAGVDGGGDRGRPVGTHDQLRASPPGSRSRAGRRAGRRRPRTPRRRPRTPRPGTRADLGEGDHEAVRQRAASAQKRAQEQVQGAQHRAVGSAASKHLKRSPTNGGATPAVERVGQPAGDRDGVGVFRRVAPVAVAVLEVQPQILDRLADQLRLDPRRDLRRSTRRRARPRGTARPCRRGRRPRRARAGPTRPASSGVKRSAGDVHGVHRLATAVLAGVGPGQECVGVGQPGVQRGHSVSVEAQPERCSVHSFDQLVRGQGEEVGEVLAQHEVGDQRSWPAR